MPFTATHIERNKKVFLVQFHRPAYTNVFYNPATTVIKRIGAETPEGAVKVARYHWANGRNFVLLGENT